MYWRLPLAPTQRFRKFSHGFCDCCSECGLCMKGWFCFWCMQSDNSARLDHNENWCCCIYPGGTVKNRKQAKAQFAIKEHCCMWLPICLFPCCSEIQIHKEISAHASGNTPGSEGSYGRPPVYMQMQ